MSGDDWDLAAFVRDEFARHAATTERSLDALGAQLGKLIDACTESLRRGGKLLFFGNGGSAADAQHLATELCVRYNTERAPLPALALTTDSSLLTAAANDLGFDQVFSRQIEALGRRGDVAVGISTSGKSANVTLALERARALGLVTAALTGRDGGDLPGRADHCLIVPSDETARIQELHILLGHALCGALELRLGRAL